MDLYDRQGDLIGYVDLEGLHLYCAECDLIVLVDANFGHEHIVKEKEMV